MSTIDYSNIASIKEFWINEIAPIYFEFEDINNYQSGIFGYINEIMANSVEDVHQAVAIARREFYPTTALYKSTLNKMATLQEIDMPLATPATGKAILFLNEKEIIDGSTFEEGMYKFVLDNSMVIRAENIPFSLDYPVVILAKKSGSHYSYTCHYDVDRRNSLSSSVEKYIPNKIHVERGVRYLLLEVNMRQVTIISKPEVLTKDSTINTIVKDFKYDGKLANFEVYYKENDNAKEIQLYKVPMNGQMRNTPFCFYEMIDNDKIRISFIQNAYFMPVYNSSIRVEIYLTEGENGMYDKFNGDLECTIQSTDYPYNNNLVIVGKANGAATGGKDRPSDEEYANIVKSAYTTNLTFTTFTDIQEYFNGLEETIDTDSVSYTKIMFRKKRDDALIRLYGAYVLMKDRYSMVVPTNTLHLKMHASVLMPDGTVPTRIPILPGQLFTYLPDGENERNYICQYIDATIADDIVALEEKYGSVFVNPFLILITTNPNLVGYYMNSITTTRSLTYTYVNDRSHVQFIAHGLHVYRNAMTGDNYYKFSMKITPSSDIDIETIIDKVDLEDEENLIRAEQNGVFSSCIMTNGDLIATIKYDDGSTKSIFINSKSDNENDFVNRDGYIMQISVGDTFIAGNVIAIKRVHDKGKIRALADFESVLILKGFYFPMIIEEHDEDTNTLTLNGYLATDDSVTKDAAILITSGIYNKHAQMDDNVTIPMKNLVFNCHIFYNDDTTNYSHKMNTFNYVKSHTLTNSYSINIEENDKLNLIQQIDFIRSTMEYTPGQSAAVDKKDFYIEIDEVPVLRASWAKSIQNYDAFVSRIYSIYSALKTAFIRLENNYSIDMKFFNTYGKAKFYTVGIKDARIALDTVNSKIKLGVYLKSISNSSAVLSKIRSFIKNYTESVNDSKSTTKSLYMLRMIADCTNEINEVEFMEYYGFNSYDYSVQTIEGLTDLAISENGIVNYIPEFININSIPQMDGSNMPDIELTLLNEESV